MRTKILGAGALRLMGALGASHVASARLSRPVEKLAIQSEEHRTHRLEAEASLASTSAELQRSARFSADASHQLKSPVTVLRTGIDSLLAREDLPREVYDELSTLLHQTYRLTGVIDDLLLLSRMDAGALQINFAAVNLTPLVAEWLDDLSALPDELNLRIESEVPRGFEIAGERRYISLIVQNLLENACKYNRPGGRVRVSAFVDGPWALFRVGNTGRTIELASQEHIFERFHRGAVSENVPGHGLGLNLARELTLLHRGDLQLVRSADDWTEFEARFRLAGAAQITAASDV
ncbi:MAG: HAMP domain-containing sensor histidine kinase [Chthoniobacterales bacterium]